jgi:hypothetical protein
MNTPGKVMVHRLTRASENLIIIFHSFSRVGNFLLSVDTNPVRLKAIKWHNLMALGRTSKLF